MVDLMKMIACISDVYCATMHCLTSHNTPHGNNIRQARCGSFIWNLQFSCQQKNHKHLNRTDYTSNESLSFILDLLSSSELLLWCLALFFYCSGDEINGQHCLCFTQLHEGLQGVCKMLLFQETWCRSSSIDAPHGWAHVDLLICFEFNLFPYCVFHRACSLARSPHYCNRAGRKLLQTYIMSSFTVVCEHVCLEITQICNEYSTSPQWGGTASRQWEHKSVVLGDVCRRDMFWLHIQDMVTKAAG